MKIKFSISQEVLYACMYVCVYICMHVCVCCVCMQEFGDMRNLGNFHFWHEDKVQYKPGGIICMYVYVYVCMFVCLRICVCMYARILRYEKSWKIPFMA